MNLKDVVIGKSVIYTPFKGCGKEQLEYGIITGMTDDFVFVRYGDDINSKATHPQDIEYIK